MPKLNFLKKDDTEKPADMVIDQKMESPGLEEADTETATSLYELNQKFDKLSAAVGQCFIALEKKIDNYKDNIVLIEEGISKQAAQHEDFKKQLQSYENKVLRLLRNIRYEIETEVNSTSDKNTKKRLGHTLDKINTSLILDVIKSKGPISTSSLEEEVIHQKICSKATLFRKLKLLLSRGLVEKEERDGTVFYTVSKDDEN